MSATVEAIMAVSIADFKKLCEPGNEALGQRYKIYGVAKFSFHPNIRAQFIIIYSSLLPNESTVLRSFRTLI
jgi:hypothetical protein